MDGQTKEKLKGIQSHSLSLTVVLISIQRFSKYVQGKTHAIFVLLTG